MKISQWFVRPSAKPWDCHVSDQIVLSGPGLVEKAQEMLLDLELSILDDDTRAEDWRGWLMALAARRHGEDEDGEPVDTDYLDEAVADAWDRLEPELACDLYLSLPQAEQVADLLNEHAGRVGIRRTA